MEMITESNVSFKSADGAVTLAGTLAIPPAGRRAPAVVLVSGTGPVDRDVTLVGHKLFRVTALRLARAGIASLRYDKRGVGESDGKFASAGLEDFVADVVGAVRHLIDREGFARERVGLVGHSEGGLVALAAASRIESLPLCVIMASPLLSGADNFARSLALLACGSLERNAEYDRYASDLAALLKIARTVEAPSHNRWALHMANKLAPRIFSDRTAVILGASEMSGDEFLGLLSSSCLDTYLGWDPSDVVRRVKCPVLAVYGTKDVQVPALENIAEARKLLGHLRKDQWEIREKGDMNHAFQRCTTGMPDEYEAGSDVMADEVLNEVASWIRSRCP